MNLFPHLTSQKKAT